MKPENRIRPTIDESLSSVRFHTGDQRAVLHAVRKHRNPRKRENTGCPQIRFTAAMAMTLLMFIPLGLLTLRISGAHLPAAPGVDLLIPAATPAVTMYPQHSVSDDAGETGQAIAIARACFESVCDTSVFTFDEYDVKVTCLQHDSLSREYTVTMTSIYGNGCAFSAAVAMPQGEVTRHSTPSLATVPAYISQNTSEVAKWQDRYGPHLIAWPQDAQAEFSRRYEGAILRTAKEGELTAEQAVKLAADLVRKHLPAQEGDTLCGYSQLYAERSQKDGVARYVVSVFPCAITGEELPEALGTVSFKTDGSDVVVTLH